MSNQPTTLPRDKYRSLVKHGYAGTKRSLCQPDAWPATHWYMHPGEFGTTLSPCYVESVAAFKRRTA